GSKPFLLPQKASRTDLSAVTGARADDAVTGPAPERLPEGTSDHRRDQKPAREQSAQHAGGERLPMESFRIEVGLVHGVQPADIISALAKEAGLDGRYVGHIDIRDGHTVIDLPKGMPPEIFRALKKVRVRGEELRISRIGSKPPRPERVVRGTLG